MINNSRPVLLMAISFWARFNTTLSHPVSINRKIAAAHKVKPYLPAALLLDEESGRRIRKVGFSPMGPAGSPAENRSGRV